MQLLQVKVQIAIVVQQLRVQLVDEMRRLLNETVLDRLPDLYPVVERVEIDRRCDAGLGLELFRRLLKTL